MPLMLRISRRAWLPVVLCSAVGCTAADRPGDTPGDSAPALTSSTSQASTLIYPPAPSGDHWGCDTDNQPPISIFVNSAGDHGACCDTHDACLNNIPGCYGDASHWATTLACSIGVQTVGCDDACIQCNLGVMSCLVGPATGPSICESYGNCGDIRRAGNPWGCTSDSMCRAIAGPFESCNNSTGLCEGPQICGPDECWNAFEDVCRSPDDCAPGTVLDANSCTCIAGCLSVCGNGVCECDEDESCPSDCEGGGGGPPDCNEDECMEECGGDGLCIGGGDCECGT